MFIIWISEILFSVLMMNGAKKPEMFDFLLISPIPSLFESVLVRRFKRLVGFLHIYFTPCLWVKAKWLSAFRCYSFSTQSFQS